MSVFYDACESEYVCARVLHSVCESECPPLLVRVCVFVSVSFTLYESNYECK